MDRFAWDDTLATGHTRMDTEHKELADRFNQLRDAVAGGKDLPACARIFDEVIAHARTHFELEQQWMAQYRYPKADQHEAEHAMLLRQAQNYRERFDQDADASRLGAALLLAPARRCMASTPRTISVHLFAQAPRSRAGRPWRINSVAA